MKIVWSIMKRYPVALSCPGLYLSILSITSGEAVVKHYTPFFIPVFLAVVYILAGENARRPQPPLE